MIIECICGKKKFEVNSELIPANGRNIQCGSCNKVWFFDPKKVSLRQKQQAEPSSFKTDVKIEQKEINIKKKNFSINKANKKNFEITKYQEKSGFTLGKFLSYILVTIISFIGLVILIDTFKSVLYVIFPSLELILFSFFELLKDIELFIKDFI